MRSAVRDSPLDDLVDPDHDVGARIDMAAGKPPHLDEGAREHAREAVRFDDLTTQGGRDGHVAAAEQLGERIAVVVGNPADQPTQPLQTIAGAQCGAFTQTDGRTRRRTVTR